MEWLSSAESRCLFAQADTSDTVLISALSLVSSLLIQTMQSRRAALPLYYACGLHTDRYHDTFPDAKGMLQNLIVQLLLAPQQQSFSLDFVDHVLFERLQNTNIDALFAVFKNLLFQLPHRAIVVLVVDGVSFYETEDRVSGMCDAMSKLIEVVWMAKCVVKLLATSSGMSSYVKKGFHEEEIVWIPDGEPGYGLQYGIGEIRVRIGTVSAGELV